jgi:autotransporter-associated beta strand protein
MHRNRFLLLLVALLLASPPLYGQVPAFPGAEGFGAYARGGRGGDVYYVTNLNTSGAGSFAEAITTASSSGRTIVFGVSGFIHVNKTSLSRSRITIAGQTAPGDGIGFKDGSFIINGSDVVIRHARFRYGDQAAGGDCINLDEGITNVILDHVSMAFSTDENISSFEQNPRPDLMTFQWSLNAWGLESHSCGGLWDLQRITTHHTLWAHHHTRNPKARPYGLLDWINNVTFDWDIGFIMGDSETPADWKANVRGNYFICPPGNLRSVALEKANLDRNGGYNFTLHVATNLFDKNGNTMLDGTDYGYGIASGSYQVSNAPIVVAGAQAPVTLDPPLTAYKKIVSQAGPLRLNALAGLSLRDEVDTVLINNLVTLTRHHITNETQTGASNNGMGTLNSTTASVDTDRDGMPDAWESALGWNPAVQDHNLAMASSGGLVTGLTYFPAATPAGYTRLEEYLHFLTLPHAFVSPNTSASPSSFSVDLRRYTSGFNQVPVTFSFSSVSNGVVILQPDGYTAVFTPTLGYSGRARFDFTVTDGASSTWRQTFGVLVSAGAQPRNLKWKGDGSANLWNSTTPNFLDGTNLTAFVPGSSVRFDDTGSNTPSLNLATALTPSAIAVDAGRNYTFAGPGALSGIGPLTKTGTGTLTLSTTNNGHGGNLLLAGGTLALTAGATLGSGSLTLSNGATLNLPPSTPPFFHAGSVTVAAGQSGTIYSPGLGNGLNGSLVSGSNSVLNLAGGVSFGGTTSSQFDSFKGTLHIQPGATLRFSANSSGNTYGSLSPAFVIHGALRPRNAGNTVKLGSVSGTGSLEGPQSNAGSGNTTYLIGGNNLDNLFNGFISSNSAVAGSLVLLAKVGSGKLTLTGNSTHTGGTTVEAGSLFVNNTAGSGTGTGALSVAGGARLGGSGFIGGATTLDDFAILSPGTGMGTLTFHSDLSLGALSVLEFELGASSDRVIANGALALAGLLNVTVTAGFGPGSYTLFTYNPAKTFNYRGLDFGTLPPGYNYAINIATPGQVKLVVSPTTPPSFSGISLSGGQVILSGTGGSAGADYFVRSTTNLASPLASWPRLATNQFDANGNFAWSNSPLPGAARQFYRFEVP